MKATPRAFVIGRVGADFPPHEVRTALSQVSGFERAVGGFGGNVSTGFARLQVPTALLAAVGDDGHGEYIRSFLAAEGVEVGWLRTVPRSRTPLAFYEVWPPAHFPVTFYPSDTYWAVRPEEVPLPEVAAAELIAVSGTSMARQPLRSAVDVILAHRRRLSRTSSAKTRWNLLDLDWRSALWRSRRGYAREMARIAPLFDVVIGGRTEFEMAGLSPEFLRNSGVDHVVIKLGSDGVDVLWAGDRTHIPAIEVETVSGLGTGDAFLAAFGNGLLDGRSGIEAARSGNAAGAIVATRHGCSTAMPTRPEIEELLGSSHQPQPVRLSGEGR